VQVSASIFATSSTEIASTGHTSAHAPHPVQASSSIFAGIVLPPFSILEFLNKSEKNVNKKILKNYFITKMDFSGSFFLP
jgi:hypothetical protein